MSKPLNSKHAKSSKLRRDRARVYALSRQIRSHDQLTMILMDIPNKIMRRAVYEQIQPNLHPSMRGYVYEGEVAEYHVSEV